MNEKQVSDDWDFLIERARNTAAKFSNLAEPCSDAIKAMWFIENRLLEVAKIEGKQLPPKETFVLVHFRRNNVYLLSSYILATMGFVWPSMNLQRTVYETILRSYLFVVNPEEAKLYYKNLKTDGIKKFLKSRRYYSHSYLRDELFRNETKDAVNKFYELLCVSAHAEFRGLLLDFPALNQREIEDRLRIILSLAYLNIQVFAETFLDRFEKSLSTVTKTAMKEIAIALHRQIPRLEPDKENYASKILLKNGNFITAL